MSTINIQETTVTTGLGSITLDGSSENGETFSSGFQINARIAYYIDDRLGNWEHGIGHLSSSNTLVRDVLLTSSTGNFVNFSTGTKYVFVGPSDFFNPASYNYKPALSVIATRVITSPHYAGSGGAAVATAGNLYYSPYIMDNSVELSSVGFRISTAGAGGTCRIGVYDTDNEGNPSVLLIETSISTASTGLILGSFTPQNIPSGKYFIGVVSTVNFTCRSCGWFSCNDTGMTGQNFESRPHSALFITGQAGLTAMPNPATQPVTPLGASFPQVFFGV